MDPRTFEIAYDLDSMEREELSDELLVITAEECAETIVACSKIIRFGLDEKNRENLITELGDVQCMINLMIEHEVVSKEEITDQVEIKKNKLKKYARSSRMIN